MNRKKNKKQKLKCNSSSPKDFSQDVLVLPPNLLQKLGINLGKICDNEDSTIVVNKDVKSVRNESEFEQEIKVIENNEESSIIETANLMKKSVFLSPTFYASQAGVLPNTSELESGVEKLLENDSVINANNTIEHADNIKTVGDDDLTTVTIDVNRQSTNSYNNESISHTKSSNRKKICILSEEIVDPTKLAPLIEGHDQQTFVPIPIDSFISVSKHYKENKEMVNNHTCLLQCNQSKAINSTHLDNNNDNEDYKQKETGKVNGEISENHITNINVDSALIYLDNKSGTKVLNTLSDSDNVDEYKIGYQEQYGKNMDTIKNEDTFKVPQETNKDSNKILKSEADPASENKIGVDCVETIASILFQHLNKAKPNNTRKNTAHDKKFSSKPNNVISKSLFQGVEKPGGEIKLHESGHHTRTYGRKRTNNTHNIKHLKAIDPIDNNKINVKIDYTQNATHENKQILDQFCVCSDFGYLGETINFENYIHPHFYISQNKVPIDVILSLYIQDENNIINRVDCDDIMNLQETSDSDHLICCNTISLDPDIDMEHPSRSNRDVLEDINFVSVPKETCLTKNKVIENVHLMQATEQSAQKRKLSISDKDIPETDVKKPKRSPKTSRRISNQKIEPVSGHEIDNSDPIDAKQLLSHRTTEESEPLNNQCGNVDTCNTPVGSGSEGEEGAVRCGVCARWLRRDEWPAHAARDHTYLAWLHGQPELDVQNDKAVYDHLYRISKENGGLTCAKCGRNRKYVKSFLSHIQSCKGEDTVDTTLDDSFNRSTVSLTDSTVVQPETTKRVSPKGTSTTKDVGQSKKNRQSEEACQSDSNGQSENVDQKEDASLSKDADNCQDEGQSDVVSGIDDQNDGTRQSEDAGMVECGVCGVHVLAAAWSEHAREQHDYLAWIQGQPKLDVENDEAVYDHLYHISKENGGLTCAKCGCRRKYVKSFLSHIHACNGQNVIDSSIHDSLNQSTASFASTTVEQLDGTMNVSTSAGKNKDQDQSASGQCEDLGNCECGVCGVSVRAADWSEHARTRHNYLAWRADRKPLALDDEEAVYNHLSKICKKEKGLTCNKCGIERKYVKLFMAHIETCNATSTEALRDEAVENADLTEGVVKCGVCAKKVKSSHWNTHAMNEHYNIAWIAGRPPIDIKNPLIVEKFLKNYKLKYGKLECKLCRLERASCVGFYAHIIQCGKTDEEVEEFKNLCEICNNKYLCVYRSQHVAMHREQEDAKQRQRLQAERQQQRARSPELVTGRRRAAQKANTVIEKYKVILSDKEAQGLGGVAGQDSDTSVEFDSASSSDTDSDVLTDHSAAEREAELAAQTTKKKRKKKRHPDPLSATVKRIPFKIKNPEAFIAEGVKDFCASFLSRGVLFERWRRCELECVPAARAPHYLPALERSCHVDFDNKWTTYELFEARGGRDKSFFVGGCIQWIAWAPPLEGKGEGGGSYLAVGCHREPDAPRLDESCVYRHPAAVQIWDFGDMTSAPKLSLCIALECGPVWAAAWCPSGARDPPAARARLGLLAVACASGSAYILPVPYHDKQVDSENVLYKIKPVAELRFSRGERRIYQATSITWTTEKGHSYVVVGYADGVVGYYNIECESPLLTEVEDGVTVFYPYDEEHRHYSCITELSSTAGGGVCSASQTGSALRLRAATLRSQLPATHVAPLPLWPAAFVGGNDLIVNQAVNELEAWGVGRRLGAVQRCGGCVRCGAFAAVVPPALRLMHLHPAHKDSDKTDIATIQMTRLNKKKSKVKNDELSVVIEPTTYEDAVKTYGVEFRHLSARDAVPAVNRAQHCERFPLADAAAVAFCPARAHHSHLALALHCGIVLLLKV